MLVSLLGLLLVWTKTVSAATSFETSYEECHEVIVGAGWAGVYSLYRRVRNDPSNAAHLCLFEQSWRIGGRTYSAKINHTTEFVQDVGAYRFSPDMHLPGDLIQNDLQLDTECYQASCPSAKEDFPEPFLFNYSAPLRRIVDPQTRLPSGYVTPLLKMIQIAKDLGARVFLQTGLSKFSLLTDKKSISLEFYNSQHDATFTIQSPKLVVLNLPRNKLFQVDGVEESLSSNNNADVVNTLKCIQFDTPADMFDPVMANELLHQTTTLGKAYLYFDDAWWYTLLNETVGAWPPTNDFAATPTKEGVSFNVRWHDGPVVCAKDYNRCHGLLEVYYSLSNETFFSSLSPSPEEPMESVWKTDGPESVQLLEQVHAGLVDLLKPLLQEKHVDPSQLTPPLGLVVGIWRRPSEAYPLGIGYTAPTKVYYDPAQHSLAQVCGVPELTEDSYRDTVLQPWGTGLPIFLVNNDWVCENVRYLHGDWAEESLLQAERAMYLLGMEKPTWLNSSYYNKQIMEEASRDYHLLGLPVPAFNQRNWIWWGHVVKIILLFFVLFKVVVPWIQKITAYNSLS